MQQVFTCDWRGRAHEIVRLKAKLKELQLLIKNITSDCKDVKRMGEIRTNNHHQEIGTTTPSLHVASPSSMNSTGCGSNNKNNFKKNNGHPVDTTKECMPAREHTEKEIETVKLASYKIRQEKEMLNRKLWKAKVRIAFLEKENSSLKDSFAIL